MDKVPWISLTADAHPGARELPSLNPARLGKIASAEVPSLRALSSPAAGPTVRDSQNPDPDSPRDAAPSSFFQTRRAVASVLTLRPRRRPTRSQGMRIRCACRDAADIEIPGRMLALAHQFA
eukprot:2369023-Pyramimonas_sp.AAC.1